MNLFLSLFSISLSAILAENFILVKFLGICPFMGVSKKFDTALGMGVAVIFVMGLASAATWAVNEYLLLPYDLEYMQTVVFILVIAALVQKLLNLGQDFGIEIQRLDGHYSCRASGRDTFLRQQGITPVAATQDLPLPWLKLALCGTDREDVLSGQATPAQDARMTQLRQQVLELCGDTCYVVRSLPLLLEIGSRKSDKGMAARRLADSLGRRVLVCAGDAPNDLQMLENADIAFVPSDAAAQMLTLPKVRITAPSGEGCIADAIAQLEAISPERR